MFFLRYVRIMPVLFSSDFSSKILSQTANEWNAAVHQCITTVETATDPQSLHFGEE